MIRVLKAILVAIIVWAAFYVVGLILVATGFGIAVTLGEICKTFAVGAGLIAGLWYGVNGGWTWTR